ncbi:ABC transporter ATP-binding protein [Paenibacillus oenotherae]|uniref:ABC transporter ATP-binding protein n=1 Tax=Paenibacillus oenotherae TaxID=1435645 RepID=A0ABS7D5D7_9BACL|nr:ABC transporter ATP-binding protein [Paenibacillus oenotherae]MBW7475066.1 ABC transporter ATP-binding protein [Paenibacillus oenotherae]
MTKPSIRISHLSKTYRIFEKPQDRLMQFLFKNKQYYRDFNALQPLSFEVFRGEAVGIIGRNGSGKSTLLQMIAGTLTPSSGEIEVDGRVAALLELGSGFNPEFTGRENVYLNASILGIGRDEIEQRFDEILKFADIGDFIDQPVKTYSSGMYVRLAFAVSINVDPDILIVDEALAVGDGRFQLKCFEKIKALKEAGKTILVVSHDLQTVRQICDKAILIDRGKLLDIGDPNDVVNHYTKVLFSQLSNEESEAKVEEKAPESAVKTFKGADYTEETKSKEYRYGNHDGVIEWISVGGRGIDEIVTLTTSEELDVQFRVKANRRITQPIFAMTVKSVKGVDVFGTNSYFRGYDFRELSDGDTALITFKQKMRLMPGDYFISLGFVELINGDIVPLDRRYDVIELKILPEKNDRSFGIANLESEIEIEYT